jgi:DNA polymerase I-like protein with 3'-5' exonuclease and polymerase domains
MSRKEAKAAIDGYFRTYPGIKSYMDEQGRFCTRKWLCRDYNGSTQVP